MKELPEKLNVYRMQGASKDSVITDVAEKLDELIDYLAERDRANPPGYDIKDYGLPRKFPTPSTEDWDFIELGGDVIDYEGELRPNGREILKNHIQSLLRSEREKLALKVEGMKKRFKCAACDGSKCQHTHCCIVLEDVKKLVQRPSP